jgi:hypothetical protein
MAKKLQEEIAVVPAAPAPLPEISFTEAEVQQVADFINYVYINGEFKMKMADTKKINLMLSHMHAHVTKCESYIFEHRRVIASRKAV